MRKILQNFLELLLATRRNVKQNDTFLWIDCSQCSDTIIRFKDKLYKSDFPAIDPVMLYYRFQIGNNQNDYPAYYKGFKERARNNNHIPFICNINQPKGNSQLWVVQPLHIGYRAVHEEKMGPIASGRRSGKTNEFPPALPSGHRSCSDQPQPDICRRSFKLSDNLTQPDAPAFCPQRHGCSRESDLPGHQR